MPPALVAEKHSRLRASDCDLREVDAVPSCQGSVLMAHVRFCRGLPFNGTCSRCHETGSYAGIRRQFGVPVDPGQKSVVSAAPVSSRARQTVKRQMGEKRLSKTCRILVAAFAVVYVGALALLLIGTFGLFGQERDPLSGVFLLPLGLPWNMFLDGLPEDTLPWAAAGAPLVNLLVLAGVCRAMFHRGKQAPRS